MLPMIIFFFTIVSTKGNIQENVSRYNTKKYQKFLQNRNLKLYLESDKDDDMHIVFGTGCNLFQHWQSIVLLNSALSVGHTVPITRLVSGCDYSEGDRLNYKDISHLTHPVGIADRLVPLAELKKSNYPNFRLHVTPTFEGAKEYPWLNKPQALEHWIKYADPPVTEKIIVILDPDFIFLKKLVINQPVSELLQPNIAEKMTSAVYPGLGVAQYYGIGAKWVRERWAAEVVEPSSPALKITPQEAQKYYSVGPPYILHEKDFRKIMPLYSKFMKKLVQVKGGNILTDMYAYVIAAAHVEVKHTRLSNYMVSAVGTRIEGWSLIPKTWDTCSREWKGEELEYPPIPHPIRNSPTFLHYCQNYHAQDSTWMFHKGHVPANILDCDLPLLKTPPADELIKWKKLKDKRSAWMVCAIIPRINTAIRIYKEKFCEKSNTEKEFKLLLHSISCPTQNDGVSCWHFAEKQKYVQPY